VREKLPYQRATWVGENPGSDLGSLVAFVGVIATSFAASLVVALMTRRMGDSLFHGLNLVYAWGAWWYQTVNVNGYYVPGQHVNHLTAYGDSVVHAIWVTWGVGLFLALAAYIALNRLTSPRSKEAIRSHKDSARMATIDDYYKKGFLAKK
jgi:hypothetical protein